MASIEGPNSGAAKCGVVCFFLVFISFTLSIGMFVFPMAPFPFSTIPMVMAAIAFFICIAVIAGSSRTIRPVGVGSGYSISTTGDAMYADHYAQPSRQSKVVFQVPTQCPSCGAPLSSENVEWVGPLQAQCPYCFMTVDASEREI